MPPKAAKKASEAEKDESSSEEEAPQVESLVSGRAKRERAGAKMASLLENEQDKDDFYTSTYGGFEEEEHDDDFAQDQSSGDEVDSDFDIDETDEPIPQDDGEDDGKKARPKRTAKMAYEVAADRRKAAAKKSAKAASPQKSPPKSAAPQPRVISTPKTTDEPKSLIYENRVLRNRRRPRKLALDSDDEEQHKSPKKKKKRGRKLKETTVKVWSQEELLAECKKTEAENVASLQKYQMLELERAEKRKAKRVSRELKEPYVRFISTSMPDVPHKVNELKTEDLTDASCKNDRVERTFITFSDDAAFKSAFPCASSNTVTRKSKTGPMAIKKGTAVCLVGHVKAKYFDPVTQIPYSSATTFKILREAYCNQLEAMYGPPKQLIDTLLTPASRQEMNTWLEWRRAHPRSNISSAPPAPQPTVVTSSSTTTRS